MEGTVDGWMDGRGRKSVGVMKGTEKKNRMFWKVADEG